MWTFVQRTGELFHDGEFVNRGWAGRLGGYKNPALQNVHDVGPLPCGLYTIGEAHHHPELGPVTMNLEPAPGNEMFGRSDFRIHGASVVAPLLSSKGCIVMMRTVREAIAASPDKELQVIAGDLPASSPASPPTAT